MNKKEIKIDIRECTTLDEFHECTRLQKEVFGLPDIEISPVRHLVVTRSAGGFILGAFDGVNLVGFVLSVPGFDAQQKFLYSHMTAISKEYQNYGIGAKLKWMQRDFSLDREVNFIKWTFQPVLARNAYFNLNRLGAIIKKYIPNYYGTDYFTGHLENKNLGLDSDRLYAEWDLKSKKVVALSRGESYEEKQDVAKEIEIPNDWDLLLKTDLEKAINKQKKIKKEFQEAFAEEMICKSFVRSERQPKYLLYGK